MRRGSRIAIVGVALAACVIAAPHVSAALTQVKSDTTHGDRRIHQELNVHRDAVHYFVRVTDPKGFDPYCVTTQLQRKASPTKWRGIGNGSTDRYRNQCFEATNETKVTWDSFIYPTPKLMQRLNSGQLRVRGSTDLGGRLILRP